MACSLNLGANPFRFAAHGIHLLDELTNPLGDQLSRSHDVELNSKVYAWMKPRHDELGPVGLRTGTVHNVAAVQPFLDALPHAATSPYAYAAYVLLLGAWVVSLWLRGQPQRESSKILAGYGDDRERNVALGRILGQTPPEGLATNEILEWVRIKANERGKTYLLIGYVATLVAAIIIVIVAIVIGRQPPTGRAETPTIQFAAAHGPECLPLPSTTRVTVSVGEVASDPLAVSGCQVKIPRVAGWKPNAQARIRIEGAGAFQLADPERTYGLGDERWLVRLQPGSAQPRLLIQLFDYAVSDPDERQRFGQFQTIVRNKIQMLAESLAARHPQCTYVADLRVIPANRQLADSPSQVLTEWRASNALAFFSGLVYRRNTEIVVRSQPYFGELTTHVLQPSRIQLDLQVNEQEFSQTTDSHSLALLYALAMDARRLGYAQDVVFTYLGEAVSVARGLDSGVPGIAVLKNALRLALQDMGAPVPEDL